MQNPQRSGFGGDPRLRSPFAAGGAAGGGSPASSPYGQQQQVTEEDVDGVKQQIRDVKQDSLASTRNALRKLEEAEQSGSNTLNMLGQQGEMLSRIEGNVQASQAHADMAAEKTSELKTANRSIFAVHVKNPFSSKKRHEAEAQAILDMQRQQREEKDSIRSKNYESQQRVNSTLKNPHAPGAPASGNGYIDPRYQFEADPEDNATESEINQNLDLMGGALSRLKGMALTMGEETASQNTRLDTLNTGAARLDDTIHLNQKKLSNIK